MFLLHHGGGSPGKLSFSAIAESKYVLGKGLCFGESAYGIPPLPPPLAYLWAHYWLAPPLLTPSVVQEVWMMYQEETGAGTFPFGPEMVYEAAALYVVTAPLAPRRGYCLPRAAGFPSHFAVRSDFSVGQGGGVP